MGKDQIEKMANIIKAVKYEPFNDGKPTYTVGNQMQDFVFSLIAEELLKYYQPKLSEDSVVLSKEEYEKLRETISDLRYDKFDLKNEISEKDNKIALLEGTIDCIKSNVGFARKETAEKIFKMLISELESNKFLYGKRIIMEVDVENLAKKYGVEVKE